MIVFFKKIKNTYTNFKSIAIVLTFAMVITMCPDLMSGSYKSTVGASSAFFTTVNSNINVTNESNSVKLVITPSYRTARINYLNEIDSADLSNFINMQVLPSIANSVDFLSMDVILEDSLDSTQQVVASVAVQSINENKKTTATVSLTDSLTYTPVQNKWIYSENSGGYHYISGTTQVAYGYDNNGWATATPQYSDIGTVLHGDRNWQGGYYYDQGLNGGPGSNNHYGYMKKDTSKDCIPFSFSFVNEELNGYHWLQYYVNGYNVARIDDSDYLTKSVDSLAVNSPYLTRYTSSHVSNMFSSGKVKLSLRFEGIQKTNNIYNTINLRLNSLRGQDFSGGTGFSSGTIPDEIIVNNYFTTHASTIKVVNESDSVKLSIYPTERTARIDYTNYISSADTSSLSNFITMQILPSVADSVDFLSMDVILEDSVDPTQQVLTSMAVQNINGNKKTVATVALTDSTEYLPNGELWVYSQNVNGYQYLLNSSQVTYGYDNGGWASGTPQYIHFGTTLHGDSNWQSGYYFDQGSNGGPGSNNHYGYLKKDALKETIPFTMSYFNKEMKIDGYNAPPTYVNGYKVAKIDDSQFLALSTNALPVDSPLRERYTSEHVTNMFSSGKVKLSLRFNGIQQTNNIYNTIELRIKSLKGQDFSSGTGFVETLYDDFEGVDLNTLKGYLVKDGVSGYTIIVPQTADAAVNYAAQELSDFIFKSTGVRIPVVNESNQILTASSKFISLGRTNLLASANLNIDYNNLNQDGFITKTVYNNLFIDGYRNSGVLYGVYNFLELFPGIKFLTTDNTYIPIVSELPLYELQIRETPAFAIRDYFSYQTMQDHAFSSRMRMKGTLIPKDAKYGLGGDKDYYNCEGRTGEGHTLELLLPASQYLAAHPDWYDSTGTEINFSNGITDDGDLDQSMQTSAAKQLINVCKSIILSKPDATYLMLGLADNSAWCTCERCNAFGIKFGGKTGTMMVFINAVAKALEDWISAENINRKLKVVALAYWKTEAAPVNIDAQGNVTPVHIKSVPRDNVIMKIAFRSCFSHEVNDITCQENSATRTTFSSWNAITNRIFVWEYTINFDNFLWYFPNLGAIKDNLLYYQTIGSQHIISQGAPHAQNFYTSSLQMYLFSKLMWNPRRDVNKLIETFNKYYFGENYASFADNYIAHMNKHFSILDKENQNGFHAALYDNWDYGGDVFANFESYPLAFLEKGIAYTDDAFAMINADNGLSTAQKDKLKEEFLGIKITPQYMILKNLTKYYSNPNARGFVDDFFSNIYTLGIRYYGENLNIPALEQNIYSQVVDTSFPIVTGVINNKVYRSKSGARVITFDRGTGTLNGNVIASGENVSATGNYTVVVTAEKSTAIDFTYVHLGDVTGDANVDVADLAKVKNHVLKKQLLASPFTLAADISSDGYVSISDLLSVKKHILGILLIQ